MDLIDDFIAQYTKEYDFYNEASRLAAEILEAALQAAGVRSLVTFRAKSITRLENKCRKRHSERPYPSPAAIYDDIVDLAGVRVALYYPDELDQVDKAISRLFRAIEPKREFLAGSPPQPNRFPGYAATHYRVRLEDSDLSESQQRYCEARIEIQVASVLMHAWSEVEHDLVYKPLQGELSIEEHVILDQLNGLVHAGELALKLLQKAAEARVSTSERRITNHYDLAALLLNRIATLSDGPVSDAELGRVDLLFELVAALRVNTPAELDPYLKALHGDVEVRPIAEQVVDALLLEDPSRYDLYAQIREAHLPSRAGEDDARDVEIGRFIRQWTDFETLVRTLTDAGAGEPTARLLRESGLFTDDEQDEIEWLRRVRNTVVHGGKLPPAQYLSKAQAQLSAIVTDLNQRFPRLPLD
jgi:ppGpp synthetase/RelA/SpoT-type nucleotidyltranferase